MATATYIAGPDSGPEEVEAAFAAIDPRVEGSYTLRWMDQYVAGKFNPDGSYN